MLQTEVKHNPESGKLPKSRLHWLCLIAIGLATVIVAIYIHNSSSQRRVARLVGINSYLPVPDSELEKAVKLEYPVGMKEQDALLKLKERGLYESSQNDVERRASAEEPGTDCFAVRLSCEQIALVNKQYYLVLMIDTDSGRIKQSLITYSLTGF
jgi:hypothetical protein